MNESMTLVYRQQKENDRSKEMIEARWEEIGLLEDVDISHPAVKANKVTIQIKK